MEDNVDWRGLVEEEDIFESTEGLESSHPGTPDSSHSIECSCNEIMIMNDIEGDISIEKFKTLFNSTQKERASTCPFTQAVIDHIFEQELAITEPCVDLFKLDETVWF